MEDIVDMVDRVDGAVGAVGEDMVDGDQDGLMLHQHQFNKFNKKKVEMIMKNKLL